MEGFLFFANPERGKGLGGRGGVKVEGLQPKKPEEAKKKVEEGKRSSKLEKYKAVLSFSSSLECPSRCSGSALVSKSV